MLAVDPRGRVRDDGFVGRALITRGSGRGCRSEVETDGAVYERERLAERGLLGRLGTADCRGPTPSPGYSDPGAPGVTP